MKELRNGECKDSEKKNVEKERRKWLRDLRDRCIVLLIFVCLQVTSLTKRKIFAMTLCVRPNGVQSGSVKEIFRLSPGYPKMELQNWTCLQVSTIKCVLAPVVFTSSSLSSSCRY